MDSSSNSALTFRLPVLHCPFTLTYHPNGDKMAAMSDKWFASGCRNFTEERHRRLNGLKAGQLTAYIYNTSSDSRLRVTCDFMNFVFHLDDLFDNLRTKDATLLSSLVMNAFASPHSYRRILPDGTKLPEDEPDASRLARDFWSRCIQDASLGFQARFCESMELFFKSVKKEVWTHESGIIMDIESYIVDRRDNSGCRPGFDLLEYTLGIELPDSVVNNTTFQAIKHAANDFVSLSNDIFSYNVEQSRGDTYNIVVIIMKSRNLDLQAAVDYIADICRSIMTYYCESKSQIPSWGTDVDRDVANYIKGMDDWLSATFYWTFMTERYFGTKHDEVGKTGIVELIPPRTKRPNAV